MLVFKCQMKKDAKNYSPHKVTKKHYKKIQIKQKEVQMNYLVIELQNDISCKRKRFLILLLTSLKLPLSKYVIFVEY